MRFDDASGVVYSEQLADETPAPARASSSGRGAPSRRGACASSGNWPTTQRLPQPSLPAGRPALGLRHGQRSALPPVDNSTCERSIRTVLSECLYQEVFSSSAERVLALVAITTGDALEGLTPHLCLTRLLAAA